MARVRSAVQSASWWTRVWRRFWVLPAVIAAASVVAGLILPLVDATLGEHLPYVFQGGADGARSVLSTIATAMISVTGVVFSVTMVVLQLASSQFSPRVLSTFLQRRIAQITLGIFIGTFLYSLTVLRSVRGPGDGDGAFVPQTSVSVAYLFVVASVVFFVAFVHQITTAVQVSSAVSRIGDDTCRRIAALAPDDPIDDPSEELIAARPHATPLHFGDRHGYVTGIDAEKLQGWAAEHDAFIDFRIGMGDFLAPRQYLGVVHSAAPIDPSDLGGAPRALATGSERTLDIDIGFGLRQLSDIALRAISPGVNDPTTAVQAINEIHVVLAHLLMSTPPTPLIIAPGEPPCGRYRPQSFAAFTSSVTTEMAYYAVDAPPVLQALDGMLVALAELAVDEADREAVAHLRAELPDPKSLQV